MAIEEGKAAPDFTLEDAEGKEVSLGDFRGRYVVVYFYPRDDTPGCTKEACGFRDLHDEVRVRGAEVLGVSPDGGAAHRKFTDKYSLPFTLLCDPRKKVMEPYGAWGEKTMYGKKTVGVDPLDGHRRPGRDGRQALAAGGEGGGPSPEGARSARRPRRRAEAELGRGEPATPRSR